MQAQRRPKLYGLVCAVVDLVVNLGENQIPVFESLKNRMRARKDPWRSRRMLEILYLRAPPVSAAFYGPEIQPGCQRSFDNCLLNLGNISRPKFSMDSF